jgi:hypothetical protein
MQEVELVARAMRYIDSDGSSISSGAFLIEPVDAGNASAGCRVTLAFHNFVVATNENQFRRVWSVVKGYVRKAVHSQDGLTVNRAGTYPEVWDWTPTPQAAS